MTAPTYKYDVSYLLVIHDGGIHRERCEIEFSKPKEEWERYEWIRLSKYLEAKEKPHRCDVSIISVEPKEE